MLRRLVLRNFVIVTALDVEFGAGFTVLTGETGAGKSILVDALQLALGSRGDAGVVREGAARTDISAEFDTPPALAAWLTEAGFDATDDAADAPPAAVAPPPAASASVPASALRSAPPSPAAAVPPPPLLLRRTIDAQGKSRAWINGSPATVAQLREAAERLIDIHGQHAWQSLTRGPAVRALVDAFARIDTAPLQAAWQRSRTAAEALAAADAAQADLGRERERLAWQIGEVDKLAPGDDEWAELNAEHRKLSNAQALLDAARGALAALDDAGRSDGNADATALGLAGRAAEALSTVAAFDASLAAVAEVLEGAQAQLQDAAHTLAGYLNRTELEPERLQALDERLSAWMGLARRYRRPPAELAALLAQWKAELAALEAAADLDALQRAASAARADFDASAAHVSAARQRAAPPLAAAVTQAMQQLGMTGGRFEVALLPQDAPQSYGLESAEFRVAGHAGSTPRPLAKVASGGELSRIALAIAVTTCQLAGDAGSAESAGTLIFDEVDAGVGGAVAETVGRLMKQLGRDRQVLAVTHLPQVAACADAHFVVSKTSEDGQARSDVQPVAGEARVAEVARMLGGERLSGTSRAHAQEMLAVGAEAATPPAGTPKR